MATCLLPVKLFPERRLLERREWWAKLRQAKRTRDTTSTKADGKSSVLKISTLTDENDPEGNLNGTPSQGLDLTPVYLPALIR